MTVFDRFNIRVVAAAAGLCGVAVALSPGVAAAPLITGGSACMQTTAGEVGASPVAAMCSSAGAPLSDMAGIPMALPGPVPVAAPPPLAPLAPPLAPPVPGRRRWLRRWVRRLRWVRRCRWVLRSLTTLVAMAVRGSRLVRRRMERLSLVSQFCPVLQVDGAPRLTFPGACTGHRLDVERLGAGGSRRRHSCTITGSPTLTVLKYHSASSGLRLMQPWLTLSYPSELTAHGAECTKRPPLLIRTASSTVSR